MASEMDLTRRLFFTPGEVGGERAVLSFGLRGFVTSVVFDFLREDLEDLEGDLLACRDNGLFVSAFELPVVFELLIEEVELVLGLGDVGVGLRGLSAWASPLV